MSPPTYFCDARRAEAAVAAIGMPCVVKPVMSLGSDPRSSALARRRRSGITRRAAVALAPGVRIVEGFTLRLREITPAHRGATAGGTSFCAPIGHLQVDGDYRESWQPQLMSAVIRPSSAQDIACAVTDDLGINGSSAWSCSCVVMR